MSPFCGGEHEERGLTHMRTHTHSPTCIHMPTGANNTNIAVHTHYTRARPELRERLNSCNVRVVTLQNTRSQHSQHSQSHMRTSQSHMRTSQSHTRTSQSHTRTSQSHIVHLFDRRQVPVLSRGDQSVHRLCVRDYTTLQMSARRVCVCHRRDNICVS